MFVLRVKVRRPILIKMKHFLPHIMLSEIGNHDILKETKNQPCSNHTLGLCRIEFADK